MLKSWNIAGQSLRRLVMCNYHDIMHTMRLSGENLDVALIALHIMQYGMSYNNYIC